MSHQAPQDVARAHRFGQSVMLDNGAFSKWKSGKEVDWPAYYNWAAPWLDYPTTWAVIPDEIGAGGQYQDALVAEWPHGERGAPVWHMDEPLGRLLKLIDRWPRVCIGSTADYAQVLSPSWCARMDSTWNAIAVAHARTPWIHMLRGMQLSGMRWPFGSVDSTDVARNHNRAGNSPATMAIRWDSMQPPARWTLRPEQLELLG